MTWLLAFAKALPQIVEIISTVFKLIQSEEDRGRGRDEAVAAGIAKANADLVYANEIGAQADADHAAHPNDDSGFDPDGERKD